MVMIHLLVGYRGTMLVDLIVPYEASRLTLCQAFADGPGTMDPLDQRSVTSATDADVPEGPSAP
jgi:hypothetical protein